MTEEFILHDRLAADTIQVAETALCLVLLMQDARYPWVILVPKRPHLREFYELAPADQTLLMAEASHIAQEMQRRFDATKTNFASLGNKVPQLHIHIIMRREEDAAWPAPVWGTGAARPYTESALETMLESIRACLP